MPANRKPLNQYFGIIVLLERFPISWYHHIWAIRAVYFGANDVYKEISKEPGMGDSDK